MTITTLSKYASWIGNFGDDCWEWIGYKDRDGYAKHTNDISQYGHRVMYALSGRKLVKGLEIDHLCRNRACVNPKHLEQVTHKVNTLRGDTIYARAKAATHCVHGHEFTETNTYIYRDKIGNHRQCRECGRAKSRKYLEKKKLAAPVLEDK